MRPPQIQRSARACFSEPIAIPCVTLNNWETDQPNSMNSRRILSTFCACGLSLTPAPLMALDTVRVASSLTLPVYVTAPSGDTSRLFILEQDGLIKIRDQSTGAVLGTPFLDLTALTSKGGERGLLGLAFHPDYASTGRFFVNYTDLAGNIQVQEYARDLINPNLANPVPVQNIINVTRPAANHNGGWIGFGPNDDLLYIGVGDSGGGNDPGNLAQSTSVLQGKILRLDVDGDDFGGDPTRNYAIPAGNPFAGATPGADEIWAYGLRNPWRPSFDRLTGDFYIADVGQNNYEEINAQLASSAGGENYGWRPWEGSHPTPTLIPAEPKPPGAIDPIHEYPHPTGFSITGGYVYRGSAMPQFHGTYFFADYSTARIWSLLLVDGLATQVTDRTAELAPGGGLDILSISSFGEDANGELYVLDRNGGEVFLIVPEPGTWVAGVAVLLLMALAAIKRRRG